MRYDQTILIIIEIFYLVTLFYYDLPLLSNVGGVDIFVSNSLCHNTVDTHTRSSADADNGLDAFSGQSRSTNIVPFHMLHIVSYCAIVTFFKTRRFYDIRLQKMP